MGEKFGPLLLPLNLQIRILVCGNLTTLEISKIKSEITAEKEGPVTVL